MELSIETQRYDFAGEFFVLFAYLGRITTATVGKVLPDGSQLIAGTGTVKLFRQDDYSRRLGERLAVRAALQIGNPNRPAPGSADEIIKADVCRRIYHLYRESCLNWKYGEPEASTPPGWLPMDTLDPGRPVWLLERDNKVRLLDPKNDEPLKIFVVAGVSAGYLRWVGLGWRPYNETQQD